MYKTLLVIVIFLAAGLNNSYSVAQDRDFEQIVKIIKSGNAKVLVKKFTTIVELNIDGEEATYSKSQAEAVLKDFFTKNPPKSFEVNHTGESKGGLPYAIGEYTSGSQSFRVWIRHNKSGEEFQISEMSFILD